MIRSISVINHLNESIVLELRFPERSGFLVQGVEGLGPAKANINMTEVATNDGALYSSARTTSRNIVLDLKLLENPTIEDTRQASYRYFPIKKQIWLLVETDNRTALISGYVESNEPDIFSASETTKISIICPDPYFYSLTPGWTLFSGVQPMFEFPFDDDTFILGNILLLTAQNLNYPGDADIGVRITIHALGPATDIDIYNSQSGELMKIKTSLLPGALSGIQAGDDIIISTVKGEKSIQFLRNGQYTNIINALDRDSTWIRLYKGDNLIEYIAATGVENLQFLVENQIAYEGV
jgi:hypothetical protein